MQATSEVFDLAATYVQLDDGPAALTVDVDDDFWETIDRRPDLRGGRLVALEAGQTCIVPRGVWHRAVVRTPGDTLHITPGEGTQHRPR